MKFNSARLLFFGFLAFLSIEMSGQDWADLSRYRTENDKMHYLKDGERRIVFMGNSIFEHWQTFDSAYFEERPIVNRGIGGQTSPQMLVRFRADVIDLKPYAVFIMAGTNDIAENTGPTTVKMILDNIFSMVQLARSNDIKVVLCSVLPTRQFPWNLYIEPTEKIRRLNIALGNYARVNNIPYIDFYNVMKNERDGLRKEYTYDGVHPNKKGYEIMQKHLDPVLLELLGRDGSLEEVNK
jgi:lysophospholipase L1-like esterase